MIETLETHRRHILAHMADAEAMLTRVPPHSAHRIEDARTELMHALGAYQLFKHGSIFYRVINGNGPMADQARRMKLACQTLAEEFRIYQLRWADRDVIAIWQIYQPAALKMIEKIRQHVHREHRGLVELITLSGMEAAPVIGYGAPRPRTAAIAA